MSLAEIGSLLTTVWAGTTLVELLAFVFGILYVVLVIGQHRACWLAAFISTALYAVLFYRSAIYMQAALQLYYVGIAVYGWRAWRTDRGSAPLAISRAGWRLQLAGLAAVAIATAASNALLAHTASATEPLLDSLTSWASVFATWLQARKKLDSWAWWLVIDLLCALLFWHKQVYPTMLLYLLYLGLIVIGWHRWSVDYERQRAPAAAVRA
jgi:nicotinamide mononucleotide transporter